MQISAADYPALKSFFVWITDNVLPPTPGLPSDLHPVAVLERFEAQSMAGAREGLGLALGDVIEHLSELDPEGVGLIDTALRADAIITLTEVRARFWTRVRRILQRGAVRNDADYYALRNAVEALPGKEQAAGWQLLAAYEERAAR